MIRILNYKDMGKKIFLMFAFVAISVSFVCAQNLNEYIGTYAGTLQDIEMNNKTGYPNQDMSFKITSKGHLVGEIGNIGKMPGTITIDLPINIDDNGTLTAKANVAGTLNFDLGGESSLVLDAKKGGFQGNIDSYKKMIFTLHVRGSMVGIPVFPASVTFVSNSFVAGN